MRWPTPAMASLATGLIGVIGLAACSRPVDLPATGDTYITDVAITPEFARAEVPIEITFLSNGLPPASVTYDIAGQTFSCEPESLSGGRLRCVHPGLTREVAQGVTLVAVKATGDDGAVSTAAGQLHVDFECPRFVSATLSKSIAQPGDLVTVNIEASEVLGAPPIVTREGRDWGTPIGADVSWSLPREIGSSDPARFSDVVVRLRDRAGNTTGDCGTDASLPFAVDHEAPVADVGGVVLYRDVPTVPASIAADPGSFIDDVGIARVRILDPASGAIIASIDVGEDGSIPRQSLGALTTSRVLVQAEDLAGKTSTALAVREQWVVSVGAGATSGAAVRSAVRYSPAPPRTTSMHDRTTELAPDILQEDARTTVIRASVGFEQVGALPAIYTNSKRSVTGYDPVGKALISVGGYNGPDPESFVYYDGYMNDVQIVRWDEREGRYIAEQGPLLSYGDAAVPDPRLGLRIAFDDHSGCGVMFGGAKRIALDDDAPSYDLWRLCSTAGGYEWDRIDLPATVDQSCIRTNYSPIVWDPYNQRYIMAGGSAATCGDTRVLFLVPGDDLSSWRWINVQPLPTTFGSRFDNILYVDPGHGGFSVAAGGERLSWTYRNGQWTTAETPRSLWFRYSFGWDYDTARRRLTLWGGNDDQRYDAWPEVSYMTQTSTHGLEAWRTAQLDNPFPRHYPNMVYDSDREVMLVFGGVDWRYEEFDENGNQLPSYERYKPDATIGPELYQLVSQPSFPYLQAVADLATGRPKGIEQLSLTLRAQGTGDLDGEGPGVARGGGVRVLLWDHVASRWEAVHDAPRDPQAGMETIEVVVTDQPERYVSDDGTVPITLVPRHPTTEVIQGKLEVDVVRGQLDLRPGVTLP